MGRHSKKPKLYNTKKSSEITTSKKKLMQMLDESGLAKPLIHDRTHIILVKDYRNQNGKQLSLWNNRNYKFIELLDLLRLITGTEEKYKFFADIKEGTRQLGDSRLCWTHLITLTDIETGKSKMVGIDFGSHISTVYIRDRLEELVCKNIVQYRKNEIDIIKVVEKQIGVENAEDIMD